MGTDSKIEWCHHTFNPWWGCAKVSPACDNCYAERDAGRYRPGLNLWGVDADRLTFGDKHWNEPLRWEAKAAKLGIRYRVFCASMADVFDKNAPPGARERLFKLIAATPHLDWLLLTKRIGNVPKMLPPDWLLDGRPPGNVWLGISVVNQEEVDRDVPKLLAIPARIRWISAEPLAGPIKLRQGYRDFLEGWDTDAVHVCRGSAEACARKCPEMEQVQTERIDWVVTGGESGPKARPAPAEWFTDLRDQCKQVGVPFLFKQWGEWHPCETEVHADERGREIYPHDESLFDSEFDRVRGFDVVEAHGKEFFKAGKKLSGRKLDGELHDGYPT